MANKVNGQALLPFYADCIELAHEIGKVIFNHCRRNANEVAHELARVCFSDKT